MLQLSQMEARFATPQEIQEWDKNIITNPDGGNMFQSKEFSEVKADNHWTPKFAVVDGIYVLILERIIPTLGAFWYLPKGPGICDINRLKSLVPTLKMFAKQNNVFLVKLESELLKNDENIQKVKKLGLKVKFGVQVLNTIIIDIEPEMNNILAGFSPKTRYNIRAAKKGKITTEIVPINDKNCDIFYDLLVELINGRAALRSREYFKLFWQSYYKSGNGIFMFAKSGNKILSTDFIIILGEKATRKDAASSHDHEIRGASALLEVAAIEYMKQNNVKIYDLCGCPPSDQIKNPDHKFYGVGAFKAGFNSNVTDFIGSLDLVIKPNAYKIWAKIGERIVHKLHYRKYKDLYY